MDPKPLTFDQVFLIRFENEIKPVPGKPDWLPVARQKGFNSVVEWRLASSLRLGMDRKQWQLETIADPNEILPGVIIGPYQGWSTFFDNKINTTFAQALEIPEFLEWCHKHDRIVPLANSFPESTTLVLFRLPTGRLICIDGSHRICSVAYAQKIGKPIDFGRRQVQAAIANIDADEIAMLQEFLKKGTGKQPG